MKKISIPFISLLAFFGCTEPAERETVPVDNYVVLLDLSDRLLASGQAGQDITAVMTVFDRFEKDVTRKLIINSGDKFAVHIFEQERPALNTDSLNNLLMIDMALIPVAGKKAELLKFRNNLQPVLEALYKKARSGNKPSDYRGVDIWKYFNESLEYDLDVHARNHLVILNDGYFDLESYRYSIRKENRYSSTFFLRFIRGSNWKEFAENQDYGLLPVEKPFPETTVTVIGIHPKNKSLYESEKLVYFWEKWLGEMHFSSIRVIKKTNSGHIRQLLEKVDF